MRGEMLKKQFLRSILDKYLSTMDQYVGEDEPV